MSTAFLQVISVEPEEDLGPTFDARVQRFAKQFAALCEQYNVTVRGQIPEEAILVYNGRLSPEQLAKRRGNPDHYRVIHAK